MNDQPIEGFLALDKPLGMSSMKALARVRVLARDSAPNAKSGHAGTLDPLATGVLIIGIGRPATREVARIMGTAKRYRTDIDLSAFSPSDDLEHPPEPVPVDVPPSRSDVDAALEAFRGEIAQAPPTYSAIKVNGKRAYHLARKDRIESLEARPVMVHDLTVATYEWPIVTLDIHCGKGFYVRSLARDLGVRLGTGGYCRSIRRTAVGPFRLEHARTLSQLPPSLRQSDLIGLDEAMSMVSRDGAATDPRDP